MLVADSLNQCIDHGELSHAAAAGFINSEDVVEIGALLNHPDKGRTSEHQITIADLTGIAAQDIAIARSVLEARAA